MGCLSEETVLGFLGGTLPPHRADEIDEHLDSCDSCRALLAFAAGSGPSADELAQSPTLPLRGTAGTVAAGELVSGGKVGRYVIRAVLGEGGMGVVYEAFDPDLDRKVAIKVLRRELAGADATARLLREGRAIAKLAHPNVVSVFDVGTYEGSVFVAMELVDGRSLDRWLAEPRDWREVVAVFLQAGAGLVAAHAAGIIHRDFKPANVLIGSDLRPRVSDFGLARVGDGDAPRRPSTPPRDSLGLLTETGAVMGTPAYMAPEQFDAAEVDARTDQFSFAVAVYEALYGERPFAGATLAELYAHIQAGEVRAAPATTRVPATVRAIVLRGLRADRAARFPSLDTMLGELRRALARPARRRRIAIASAAATGTAALAVAATLTLSGARDPCADVDRAMNDTWGLAAQAQVIRAFGSVRAPYAGDALVHTFASLDEHARQWRTMQRDACRVAQVRHEQTVAQHGLRAACLDQRLTEMTALVALLAKADERTVRHAAQAVDAIAPVESCANVAALSAVVPPPAGPVEAARLAELRGQLADANARALLGNYKEAAAAANAIVPAAEALGYKPFLAEVLLEAGSTSERAGDPKTSEQLLTRAAQAAAAGRDDYSEAQARLLLVDTVGSGLEQFDRAQVEIGYASAAIERLGGDARLQATLDGYHGSVLMNQGKAAEARVLIMRALEARRRLLAPDDPRLIDSLMQSGSVAMDLGRYDEAKAAMVEALERREKALGPNHPEVSAALHGLGQAQLYMGDPKGAEVSLRRSQAIAEATVGADHPMTADIISNLGLALQDQGRFDEATAAFTRSRDIGLAKFGKKESTYITAISNLGAVAILQHHWDDARRDIEESIALSTELRGANTTELATDYVNLAQVYSHLGRWTEAFAACQHAIAIDTKAVGEDNPRLTIDYGVLAELYLRQRDLPRAIATYRKVVATMRSDSSDRAAILGNLARALLDHREVDEAEKLFREALELDEKRSGATSKELVFALGGLGEALLARGQRVEAVSLLERALALHADELHPDAVVRVKYFLGNELWATDRTRARRLVEQARDGAAEADEREIRGLATRWLATHPR